MTDEEITLKEYMDLRFDAMEQQFTACIKNQEKALDIARESIDKRLEGMNEFRAQLKDQANTFITRHEYSLQVEKYDMEVRGLRESRAELAGKASQKSVNIAIIFTACSLVIAIIAVLLPLLK